MAPSSPLLARLFGAPTLPRSTRDLLFLLLVIGWTLLPHAAHLPPWCGVLVGATLLWRARLAWLRRPLPPRPLRWSLLALALALTAWSHGTLLGRDAGVTLLAVLMALKTLELHARRDALVVFFLGFFLILTQFLYTQTPLRALATALSAWGLMTVLVLAHRPLGYPPLREAAGVAAGAALRGAPLALLLFLLFPRLGPLWGPPAPPLAQTGLSGRLSLGGMEALARDDREAFRVRFDGPAPPLEALYWRGPVLSDFDGREWRPRPTHEPAPPLQLNGPGLRYEMLLKPSPLPALPLLELTALVDTLRLPVQLEAQGGWTLQRPLAGPMALQAHAWPDYEIGPLQATAALRDDVQLPAGFNPRTLQWAAALRQRLPQADAAALVEAVLTHVRQGGFAYTLAPGGGAPGPHAVDAFWIDRREGFCEHFAAAFVVVMRALDVPARIVTGYQGADPPDAQGWWSVRNRHAHAWAEVWIDGRGWRRVDPTAAVAPDRVRQSALLQDGDLLSQALQYWSPALLQRWHGARDGFNAAWNRTVLQYSRAEQFRLLRRLGIEAPGTDTLLRLLGGALALAGLVGALAAARGLRRPRDPWLRLQPR
ncbi:transglutaminase family protein, partial [Azohydromonas aeria]|uniref:transglutaminase family protein n=1 Tax=Azohydromonas aeria TaxID=2590212 RepID=UPI0012F8C327